MPRKFRLCGKHLKATRRKQYRADSEKARLALERQQEEFVARNCGICEEEEQPLKAFRTPGTAQAEYCSRCMHYVSQVTGKSGSRSTYTVNDIKQAHKDGLLDKLFVPLGHKRCSNCTAVLPIARFAPPAAAGDSSRTHNADVDIETQLAIGTLLDLCSDCRAIHEQRTAAKLHCRSTARKAAPQGACSTSQGGGSCSCSCSPDGLPRWGSQRPRSKGPGTGATASVPRAPEPPAHRDTAAQPQQQQQPACVVPHVERPRCPANVAACAEDVGAGGGRAVARVQTARAAAVVPGGVADAARAERKIELQDSLAKK